MKFPSKIAVSSALAAGLMLIGAVTASANQATVRGGGVNRGYGGVNNHGHHIYACDTRNDGWGVRTRYTYRVGAQIREDVVGDGNGSSTGCGEENLPSGFQAVRFNVCAGPGGADAACTGWIIVNQNDRATNNVEAATITAG